MKNKDKDRFRDTTRQEYLDRKFPQREKPKDEVEAYWADRKKIDELMKESGGE